MVHALIVLQEMNTTAVSDRHKRYLLRFERNRKRWEPFSSTSDIIRLRQIEAANYVLTIYFVCNARSWIEYLIFPQVSWMSILSALVFSFLIYIFYTLYWVSRSINYMVENGFKNVAQFVKEDAEQAAS